MTEDRNALRQRLRAQRRALPAAQRLAAADSLATRLLTLPFAPQTGAVAGYWAMDGEIALHRWQLGLPAGVRYCLPVLDGRVLRFAPWRPGQALISNRYGIPEPDVERAATLAPEEMALVVAPLTGFDAACRRLGMGGGWYDRSFAFRHRQAPPPWLVGAGFAAQQVPALPTEPWDVAVDAICTEHATFLKDDAVSV
ncbi:5-formyltetrahydrofolate cyclo-ligase [Xanthomonas melonis]|uniref:5-formyltetrahydrofolate cyclo-ligase n=1 Tax=Xanthomonas melonis TaxID=56456 RepID=A0A2S7DI85_9XANT|nr:5-formyltetrahydrofolate cyclo-ligase [Xanthomonas melonis]MCC4599908.1 5-formyltetrahydrofolate cyclo-ligase [Xanthomonas melonis]MCD0259697.1 5-formyltetrahydrofolate cyclo-ligase [Xanthomonas melonis]MCD0268274.1 5-formyltetrahydrofolate cyclo-ligase [Xanthomonas melonis]MCD0281101.1 5-formyltetrahydrofolate cyclo-ligase [Xanthomonas melonis]PPU73507.1 5-formyltetrahydrofolate cyclo-ligase [Xanthomonas melonis]